MDKIFIDIQDALLQKTSDLYAFKKCCLDCGREKDHSVECYLYNTGVLRTYWMSSSVLNAKDPDFNKICLIFVRAHRPMGQPWGLIIPCDVARKEVPGRQGGKHYYFIPGRMSNGFLEMILKVRTSGPEPESPLGGRHGLLCAHHLSLLLWLGDPPTIWGLLVDTALPQRCEVPHSPSACLWQKN